MKSSEQEKSEDYPLNTDVLKILPVLTTEIQYVKLMEFLQIDFINIFIEEHWTNMLCFTCIHVYPTLQTKAGVVQASETKQEGTNIRNSSRQKSGREQSFSVKLASAASSSWDLSDPPALIFPLHSRESLWLEPPRQEHFTVVTISKNSILLYDVVKKESREIAMFSFVSLRIVMKQWWEGISNQWWDLDNQR